MVKFIDLRVSTHAHEYKDLDAVKLFVNECAGHVLHGLFPAFALYELAGHGVHSKVSEVVVDKAVYPALHSQASLFIFGFVWFCLILAESAGSCFVLIDLFVVRLCLMLFDFVSWV